MGEITIAPCPCCGEDRFNRAVTRGRDNRYFINHYDKIFHIQSSIGFDSPEAAAEAWNILFGKTKTKKAASERALEKRHR